MRRLSEIYESHWSEMNRRSQGIKVRKEDDLSFVDTMNKDEFCDFLYKRYKKESIWFIGEFHNVISFPLFSPRGKVDKKAFTVFISGYTESKKYVYIWDDFISGAPDEFEKIQEHFELENANYNDASYIKIYPKNHSEITNSFFINVIDFILDHVDENKYIKLYAKK